MKKPTIEIATEAGACFGVERALKMVNKAAAQHAGSVQTLGPLIHNPQVVSQLAEKGVDVAEDINKTTADVVVIRSHGVAPEVVRRAKELSKTVLDATCPYVKKVHRLARLLEEQGYQVLMVGELGHAEVEGTLGNAPSTTVISKVEDLEGVKLKRKVGVIVQTTQSRQNFQSVILKLLTKTEELRIFNTICDVTTQRQHTCALLAQRSDVMIVIGGKNSANTTRLTEIATQSCPNTHHIEIPQELQPVWFEQAEHVGITAGASTPADQIMAVHQAIEKICEAL